MENNIGLSRFINIDYNFKLGVKYFFNIFENRRHEFGLNYKEIDECI
jgi:hypothetical protein